MAGSSEPAFSFEYKKGAIAPWMITHLFCNSPKVTCRLLKNQAVPANIKLTDELIILKGIFVIFEIPSEKTARQSIPSPAISQNPSPIPVQKMPMEKHNTRLCNKIMGVFIFSAFS